MGMTGIRTGIMLCLTAFGLAGCSHTVWQKPGGSQSEYEQIKAICLLEGHDRVPQDNRTVLLSQGQRVTQDKCKDRNNCATITQYTPPQYGIADANEGLRDQVVRGCLYRNGWQEVVIED